MWYFVAAAVSCCQGKPWQFKEFTQFKGADKGDMVETFSNIFGAFFHYKDEQVSRQRERMRSHSRTEPLQCTSVSPRQ